MVSWLIPAASDLSPERSPDYAPGRILSLLLKFALVSAALLWAVFATAEYAWQLPPGFPVPLVPPNNPMSVEKVAFGRLLFFDERLSSTGRYSCASCHRPEIAFTDGRKTAIGATGEAHTRNTPSLINAAYNASFGWADPVTRTLEQQHLIPMFNTKPVEMGLTVPNLPALLARLSEDPSLKQLAVAAYPDAKSRLTLPMLTGAIASYVRTLISGNSAYDRYLYFDDRRHFSDAAYRGMALFFSDRLKCSECHASFNFSGPVRSRALPTTPPVFHNTGLYNLAGSGSYPDPGLFTETGKTEDMGAFRAPSLRNVEVTAPYMHDGSMGSLEEVVEFYASGGREILTGPYQGDGKDSPYKREQIMGFRLSIQEKHEVVAFLTSLTDDALSTTGKIDFVIRSRQHSDPLELDPCQMRIGTQGFCDSSRK